MLNASIYHLGISTFVILLGFVIVAERRSRARAEKLAEELEGLAANLERVRIARDMHDSLGHTLTALDVKLEVAQELYLRDPDRARQAVHTAKQLSGQCLQDVRLAVQAMRRPPLHLGAALEGLAEQVGIRPAGDPQRLRLAGDARADASARRLPRHRKRPRSGDAHPVERPAMIRLLLVDDQPLFREGLADLLLLEEDMQIVGQAGHGQEAITLAMQRLPDVILMDVRMPVCDGVEATRQIHQRYPWIRILVLTTFDEDEYILQSLQAGALGYLLKSTPARQVAAAVRALHQGHSQLGPTIAAKVFSQLQPSPARRLEAAQHFSERELEVLGLIGQGKSHREIAQALHLTEGTVKNHISRILAQLGLRDRTQLALWTHKHLG
ncbi:MAG: response regulator [Aphanocapsa lilacina HA4352-LM1]|jgi:DNA-binding NarL/FixJ family response regulator|nr:response regulator [Aphanocapsa lilacina HA4352-LM1]